MLVELSVMEQRYQAVLAVTQDGRKVCEVAEGLWSAPTPGPTGSARDRGPGLRAVQQAPRGVPLLRARAPHGALADGRHGRGRAR